MGLGKRILTPNRIPERRYGAEVAIQALEKINRHVGVEVGRGEDAWNHENNKGGEGVEDEPRDVALMGKK